MGALWLRLAVCTLGCACCLASPAAAATFYVDAEHGADERSGTRVSEAWQTVARVDAQDLDPGDRVLFRGGQRFEGTVHVNSEDAGTRRRRVVIGSFGHGRATIAAGDGKGVSVYNAAGVEVRELIVTGTSYADDVRVHGVEFYTDLPGTTKLAGARLHDVDVSGFGDSGVLLGAWASDGTKSGYRDVRIERVASHDNGDAGISSYGYFDPAAAGWAHENVYVGHNRVYRNRGVPGKGNHSGDGIVLGDLDRAVVERNVAFENGADNDHAGGGPVGIWTWDSNRVVIQHNESYANKSKTLDGGGIDLDGGVTNSVLQFNYSHDNYGAGYLIAQFPGARPFHDNVVRYNVSENDGRNGHYAGIHFWTGGSAIVNTRVHNNVVFVSPQAGADPAAVRFWSPTVNTQIYDNVFMTTGGLPLVDAQPGDATGARFTGNVYWMATPAVDIRWGAQRYDTLEGWRAATGQERDDRGRPTGLVADPRLRRPGGGGTIGDARRLDRLSAYQQLQSSPLRDRGAGSPARGARDFFGTRVPQGRRVDVGIHEWRDGR